MGTRWCIFIDYRYTSIISPYLLSYNWRKLITIEYKHKYNTSKSLELEIYESKL
jgi:hypothetical protein